MTLADDGYALWPHDAGIAAWAGAALPAARAVLADPQMRAQWLQCEGTWFVGVDALPSTADGAIRGQPLRGAVIDALAPLPPLHPAQLSVTFPGYPRPRAGESAAAFRYRCNRDAAHVDGILAEGAARRRHIREPHAFVLGLPLTECGPGASPLVVWRGSHRIMGTALGAALAPHTPESWPDVDVTDAYQAARRLCFDTCERVELSQPPGAAILLHPLTLHGIAPWRDGAVAPPEGRMMAYFRPPEPHGIAEWLSGGACKRLQMPRASQHGPS